VATFEVGTSGWQYRHWRSDFYPEKLPLKRWFEHYAGVFSTVELNNSFYRQPPMETWQRWREQARPGFCYAVKANRFISHIKRFSDPKIRWSAFSRAPMSSSRTSARCCFRRHRRFIASRRTSSGLRPSLPCCHVGSTP
jgi:uncharacterized protein YecE (DUF72 family)